MLWKWSKSEHSLLFLHAFHIQLRWWWHTHGSLSDHLKPTQAQTFKSKDKKTPNNLSHYRLHEFPYIYKRYFWFESFVVYKCGGFVSFFFKWWMCHFETHLFIYSIIKTWRCGMIKLRKAVEKSSTKTFKLLLWSEGPCNFVNHLLLKTFPQHWILMSDAIWRWQKFSSLLRRATCR